MASSISVLSDEEMEAGVVLVDIGGGTTDVAIFHDNIIRHTAVIPFGGNIITQDIKQGCMVMQQQAEKLKTAADTIAESIGDLVLDIAAKVGEGNRIFGRVTTTQISDALKAKGFDIDRKRIQLPKEVKVVGDYKAILDLHKEVKKEVAFRVVAD